MPLVQTSDSPLVFSAPYDRDEPTRPPCESDDVFATALGRDLAFPLYLSCSTAALFDENVDYKPGRICIASQVAKGLFRPDIHELLCPQDVVHAWLYQVHSESAEVPFVDTSDAVLGVMRDLAPQVKAVMVANDNAETGFMDGAHDGFVDRVDGGSDEERASAVLKCTEFVKRSGNLIRDMGGRPAYGLYHFHALLHAYWAEYHFPGGDPLRQAIQDLDALVIVFIGYTFWLGYNAPQPTDHWDPHGVIVPKGLLDPWPFPRLIAWLASMECWGGVNYLRGLEKHNDTMMGMGGFKAGVIGELPPATLGEGD